MSRVYVECNPLLDISAHVDEAFLAKYKLEKASATLCSEEQLPIYADMEKMADVKYIPGGSGLNTARVAQWMAQAPKHSLVTYVGSIADDKYGKILKDSAEDEGVTMAVQYDTKAPTGSCAVCIVGKERTMCANLAAANNLAVEHLSTPKVAEALTAAQIFYFTGFTLTISTEHVLKAAKQSIANKGTFTMNLSAPFIMQFFADQFKAVLPFVDVIFSNDDEAKVFSQTMNFGTEDVKEIAVKAAQLPTESGKQRLVVFTCGSAPTVYATAEGAHEVPVAPIAAEKIIDTNGAGDAFVGGYLAAMAQGKSVVECINAGNYSAGVIIQNDGCTFPAKPEYAL